MQGWRDIQMPETIAALPRDERGFPITFVTLIQPDGKPDFTTIDARKIKDCISEQLCGLCGTALIDWDIDPTRDDYPRVAFIGGPLSIEHNNFLDPPMHEECAAYALQVCPHIVHDTSRYKKQDLSDGMRTMFDAVSDERPDRFGMLVVVSDAVGLTRHDGQPVFVVNQTRAEQADGFYEVRWQDEPQLNAEGEELVPYFESRYFRLEAHEDESGQPCMETTIVTHGRHLKNGADKLITVLCVGCNVLHALRPVTDPEEIERLMSPEEDPDA